MLAAVSCAVLVVGADTLFAGGEVARFAEAWSASGADGALAVTGEPGTVRVRDGLVEQVLDEGLAGAPLWAIGEPVAAFVEAKPGSAPWELATAFQHAIDAGHRIAAIRIGPTRGLTTPPTSSARTLLI